MDEKLTWNLSDRVKFEHQFDLYPNLSDRGQFRLDTGANLGIRLTPRFSLNINSRYLSQPVPGGRKNDLLLTVGLRF